MPTLADLLRDLTGGNESLAETAAAEIAKLGPAAIPALSSYLNSPDPDQRWWALRALAQIPQTPAGCFMEKLSDPWVEVRQAAALALVMHPQEAAIAPLLEALKDEDRLVGTLAAKALAEIGKPAVPPILAALTADAQPAVRIHLMQVLAEIRDPRSIPVMMKAMEEDSALLNHWAEEGLERLGLDMVYIKPG